MSDDTAKSRYRSAAISGGRPHYSDEWSALVRKAVDWQREQAERFTATFNALSPSSFRHHERTVCGPGCVPVRYQTILDLECLLAQTQMFIEELEQLGVREDAHVIYQQSLLRTIERARKQLTEREHEVRRSQLKAVP